MIEVCLWRSGGRQSSTLMPLHLFSVSLFDSYSLLFVFLLLISLSFSPEVVLHVASCPFRSLFVYFLFRLCLPRALRFSSTAFLVLHVSFSHLFSMVLSHLGSRLKQFILKSSVCWSISFEQFLLFLWLWRDSAISKNAVFD